MKKFRLYVLVLVTLLLCAASKNHAIAQNAPTIPASGPPAAVEQLPVQPPIVMVVPGIFEVGGCRIVKKYNRVEFPAQVNLQEGLLEYLVVGKSGKLHESLLKTAIEPYALQIALLLAGFEGTLDPLTEQGQRKTPEGTPVSIWLSWMENGKEKKERIHKWLLRDQNPIQDSIPWVFTGSVVRDGIFLAQVEKSIIAVFHDPTALIDHQMKEGESDEVWFANSSHVPPQGTDVTVIIEKK